MQVLFAAHPTVGHTNALRAIGAELRARGHRTSFAIVQTRVPWTEQWPEPVQAATRLPAAIEAEGAQLLPLTPSLSTLWHAARLTRATGQAELEIALTLFTGGLETQAREIAAHARRVEAAAVVADYLMPAAMLGARLAGRPFVALYHSALIFPGEGAPPFGTTLPSSARGTETWRRAEARLERMGELFDRRVAQAARRLGVPSGRERLLRRPLSDVLNLLATAPELEPGLLPLEGPVVMTGPCLPSAPPLDDEGLAVLASLPRDARRVYVSLGTVFNEKPEVYRALIQGATATGAHVIVSAGASLEALASLRSPTVHLFRRVPQVQLLERVDAVLTHGGNNTVQECLGAGRPMVVVPFGGDQATNAWRVERLGVGVHLPPRALTAAAVREALAGILDARVVARAEALSRSLAGYGGVRAAADAILGILPGLERLSLGIGPPVRQ